MEALPATHTRVPTHTTGARTRSIGLRVRVPHIGVTHGWPLICSSAIREDGN